MAEVNVSSVSTPKIRRWFAAAELFKDRTDKARLVETSRPKRCTRPDEGVVEYCAVQAGPREVDHVGEVSLFERRIPQIVGRKGRAVNPCSFERRSGGCVVRRGLPLRRGQPRVDPLGRRSIRRRLHRAGYNVLGVSSQQGELCRYDL